LFTVVNPIVQLVVDVDKGGKITTVSEGRWACNESDALKGRITQVSHLVGNRNLFLHAKEHFDNQRPCYVKKLCTPTWRLGLRSQWS
jgi:hypothetical protein